MRVWPREISFEHVQLRDVTEADFPVDGPGKVITTPLASAFKVKRVNNDSYFIHPCPDIPSGTAVRGLDGVKQRIAHL